MEIRESVEAAITRRAEHIAKGISRLWKSAVEFDCIIAGGSLGTKINDIDIFKAKKSDSDIPIPSGIEQISMTRNAVTLDAKPWPIQICSYAKDSLKELVESFDFAHIQAGAVVGFGGDAEMCEVKEIYITDAFVVARAVESTWFVGSEYPISSLIRAGKYFKNGTMQRGGYLRSVLDTLSAVVKRGVDNYEDFKDQLDAVDLGLLPEELSDVERSSLQVLFDCLRKDKP